MATKELAKFVAELQYDDLPTATREKAKQCLLDWLACCIRGSVEPPAQIMQEIVISQEGKQEATVFAAKPFLSSALYASLANGAASHALDMDDLHNASIIHLGTVVVPAIIAIGEQIGATGEDVIAAIVAGYEVGARVGEAVNPDSYHFWHTTGTAGTLGAAAAAGKLLGLDAEQLAHCLGSAGTQAAGLWEFLEAGAMSKTLHAGKAAMNGILAALLARKGFTGATTILEGVKGFCLAMASNAKIAKLTDNLGQGTYKIDENSFKPYAACKHCHASINACQILGGQYILTVDNIKSILVRTNSVANNLVNNPNPQNSYGCKFSLQYCVAAALRYGQAGVAEFTADKIYDKKLRGIMGKVVVEIDEALDEEYSRNPEKWSVLVTITTVDGQQYQQFIDYPKGDPQNPVSYVETQAKFTTLVTDVYTGEKLSALVDFVNTIEKSANVAQTLRTCLSL